MKQRVASGVAIENLRPILRSLGIETPDDSLKVFYEERPPVRGEWRIPEYPRFEHPLMLELESVPGEWSSDGPENVAFIQSWVSTYLVADLTRRVDEGNIRHQLHYRADKNKFIEVGSFRAVMLLAGFMPLNDNLAETLCPKGDFSDPSRRWCFAVRFRELPPFAKGIEGKLRAHLDQNAVKYGLAPE